MSADERVGTAVRERLAADLAVRGGRMVLEHFHRVQMSCRPEAVPAADHDAAIQEQLALEIARAFPDDAVVGEEGHGADGRAHGLYSWVIDSVDGTDDFGRGLPGFAVSIGVLRNRQPFAGAVYDPITRWLFTACAGRGAWLNERALRTRPTPLSRGSLVSIRTPVADGMPPFIDEWLRRYRIRRFGSTALHLCYVALGALDLVYDDLASLRDIAGAVPILLEAGGALTAADGAPLFPATVAQLDGRPIALVAGNPASHAQAVTEILAASALHHS